MLEFGTLSALTGDLRYVRAAHRAVRQVFRHRSKQTGLVSWLAIDIFFKQKTAYEISECDWSSDVCSSD
eukprot:COSAG02_NODE_21341_length_792_cov_1.227994_2_plen_68_part_01